MKKLFSLLLLLFCFSAGAQLRTPFVAYTSDIVGDTLTNTITIQAWSQTNLITGVNTQLVASFLKHYYPTNPAGVITGWLAPGNYKLSIAGVDRSITFGLPYTNSQVNLAQMAGVPIYAFQNFTLAQFSDAGTAAYSNAAAFLRHSRTNWSVSEVTNAGTIAYSNATDYLHWSDTNWPLARITNAGSAAYHSSNNWLLHSRTNWAVAEVTNAGTMAYSNATTFINFMLTNAAGAIWYGTLFTTNLNANVGQLTNGTLWNSILVAPTLTNGVNYGSAFASIGSASGAEQFGSGATATGVGATALGSASISTNLLSTALGRSARAAEVSSTAVGAAATASGSNSTAVGTLAVASGSRATALGNGTSASATGSSALGWNSTAAFENSTAVGAGAQTTRSNQTVLGSGTVDVDISGNFSVAGYQTNGAVFGTNSFSDMAWRRHPITSLANGDNAGVIVGTNTFVQVSGPTAAFAIHGFNGSPNRNGHFLILLNQTGYEMTLGHESGIEPTAANRIISPNGMNMGSVGNAAAMLVYNSAAARWQLLTFLNSTLTTSYAELALSTGSVASAASIGPNTFAGWSGSTRNGAIGFVSNTYLYVTNAGTYDYEFGSGILAGNANTCALILYTNNFALGAAGQAAGEPQMEVVMPATAAWETGFKAGTLSLAANTVLYLATTNSAAAAQTLRNAMLRVHRVQ